MQKIVTRSVLIIDDNPAVGEVLSLNDIRPLNALTPDEGLAMLQDEAIEKRGSRRAAFAVRLKFSTSLRRHAVVFGI